MAANIPRCILGDLDRLVVAYGEAAPAVDNDERDTRWPVSWVAQRLGSGEQFACTIQPRCPLDASILRHLQVSRDELDAGLDARGFLEKWHGFLRPADTIIVYSHGTAKLLSNMGTAARRCRVLKSVDIGVDRRGKTLGELLAGQGVAVCGPKLPARAGQRLANTVAWVLYLRNLAQAKSARPLLDRHDVG